MEQAAALWRYQALHEDRPYHNGDFKDWAAERTAAHPYHYLDGVTVYVARTDLNPADGFLADERATPRRESVPKDGQPDHEPDR